MAQAVQSPVKFSAKGDKLFIEINTKVAGKPSASGKTNVLATTKGFTDTPFEGIRCGLNLIRKAT